MNRFDRQERISGWDQSLLARGKVAVHGRGWLGVHLVWALRSLGVGHVIWIGRPQASARSLADWVLAEDESFEGSRLDNYALDAEYESVLDWCLQPDDRSPLVLAECSEQPAYQEICRRFASRHPSLRLLAGGCASGGWLDLDGGQGASAEATSRSDPITAMAVAGLLTDAVRSCLCPLSTDIAPVSGSLEWAVPETMDTRFAVLVGAGGIGCYAAELLAARGHRLLVVDSDHVEETNRNRQGLFTRSDALEQAKKAGAAVRTLRHVFPEVWADASVQRVGEGFADTIKQLAPGPSALLSAVDNGRTRLVLQSLGQDLSLPTIQAGTDVFGADCFTQAVDGPSLDEQMHGALSDAASAEGAVSNRGGGCVIDPSYIVPGMVAGAMIAYRFEQLSAQGPSPVPLSPLRWRQGELPFAYRNPNYEHDIDSSQLCGLADETCG